MCGMTVSWIGRVVEYFPVLFLPVHRHKILYEPWRLNVDPMDMSPHVSNVSVFDGFRSLFLCPYFQKVCGSDYWGLGLSFHDGVGGHSIRYPTIGVGVGGGDNTSTSLFGLSNQISCIHGFFRTEACSASCRKITLGSISVTIFMACALSPL